jgi:hypothetical protein
MMNKASIAAPVGIAGKFLAVLCVVVFWVLPFSPFVAIAGLATTRHAVGWPRTIAKTGAILTVLWGTMFAVLFLWILLLRILNGSWDF